MSEGGGKAAGRETYCRLISDCGQNLGRVVQNRDGVEDATEQLRCQRAPRTTEVGTDRVPRSAAVGGACTSEMNERVLMSDVKDGTAKNASKRPFGGVGQS